ncbi:hypothetical protein PTMSG1_04084 [Pyrenophora teres f. maculata]|nr:hypothetical protein PTMSG1_04084 [Pyrenophora teres f. maculata]
MATDQSQRDATVILTDSSNWIPWYHQLKIRCQPNGIWALIDPNGTQLQRARPEAPLLPDISEYEPLTSTAAALSALSSTARHGRGNTRGAAQGTIDMSTATAIIPRRVSELSERGKEAYKEDCEDYKLRLEAYQMRVGDYERENKMILNTVEHMLKTVSPHLQLSCCAEDGTLREWIIALRDAVGVSENEERARVRERYRAALSPMGSPQDWESWLSEYDQAATRAESVMIAEVIQNNLAVDDFLRAVSKIAPAWVATFTGAARGENNMERRQVVKLFHKHMSLAHPTRGKLNSAFMRGEAALAASGESDSNTLRAASSVETRGPFSNNNAKQNRGKARVSNKRKMDGQSARARQFPERNTATAGERCPACHQHHKVADCYYVNTAKAPEWFKPNRCVAELVQYKLQNDADFQRAVEETSADAKRRRLSTRSRSRTPYIKTSHTPDRVGSWNDFDGRENGRDVKH